jgi:four helix bundle protein
MSSVESYTDLRIWQQGMKAVKEIYTCCRDFPSDEKYGLTSQMKRAAISIPSNIAEGFCRLHNKEYKQFLSVSLGSCAELITQVHIAKDLNFLKYEKAEYLIDLIEQESKQIRSLISKLST